MAKHNRFKQGSGAYTCYVCEKVTRDTGHDEGQLGLCYLCLLDAYVENTESDYGKDSQEHKDAIADHAAQAKKEGN